MTQSGPEQKSIAVQRNDFLVSQKNTADTEKWCSPVTVANTGMLIPLTIEIISSINQTVVTTKRIAENDNNE